MLFLLRISAVKRPLGPQAVNMYDVVTSCCIFVIKTIEMFICGMLNHVTEEKSCLLTLATISYWPYQTP